MNDLSFDSILEELQNSTKTFEILNLRIKELTLKHQRMILNIGNEPIAMPAKLSCIYNNFISELVELTDQMCSTEDVVTICQKPFILNIIRKLSIGDDFIKNDETYHLYDVTEKDIEYSVNPKQISFANFVIDLKVPVLKLDSYFNEELINELKAYKKKNFDESELGAIGDLYQIYEIMKFVDTIKFKNNEFKFIEMSLNERKKFLNLLPKSVSDEIVEYIKEVKKNESDAYKIVSEDDKVFYVDSSVLFFGKEID